MGLAESNGGDEFHLTPEHEMLLRMRDALYEGSWEDFAQDLRARSVDRPHVFEIVPPSPEMKSTIASHLRLIDEMEAWERAHGRTLQPSGEGS